MSPDYTRDGKKDEMVKVEDPSKMTDEELAAKVNPEEAPAEAPAEPEESKTEEDPKEEVEAPEEAPAEEAESEDAVSEEGEEVAPAPPSRREQLRVQQLLKKYGNPQPLHTAPRPTTGMNYGQDLDASPEIVKQLEDDRQLVSDQAYQQGIDQVRLVSWKNTLRMEAPQVEAKHKFLDSKDSENFNPAAADAMNSKYLRFIGWQPGDPQRGIAESVSIDDLSYGDFVESEMEFIDELATQKNIASTRNIAKQAAQTGLRPDGNTAKRLNLNQAPENMTDEELYAAIGQPMPKK